MTTTDVRPEVDVTDGKQGIGGRPASGEPDSSKAKVLGNGDANGSDARWVAKGFQDLSTKVLAARESIGRPTLAEFAGASQSAIWRWERDRITHGELEAVQVLVKRIDAGELPAAKAKGRTSAVKQAQAILARAAEDKSFTKAKLIEELLALFPVEAA